jgi:plastocyanin
MSGCFWPMNGLVLLALTAAALATPGAASGQPAGGITGTVSTAVPAPRAIRVSFDQRVCGTALPDQSILVNAAGGLANAVVTVVDVKARAVPREVSVRNEKCAFTPRVQVVAPNGTVKTSSSDPILHTTVVQTSDGRQLYNLALPMPGIELSKPLGAAGVLRIGCSTHQWMRGWIIVSDELSVVTGPDGGFSLPNLPPGSYRLRFWHESLKAAEQTVTVAAGKAAVVAVAMK